MRRLNDERGEAARMTLFGGGLVCMILLWWVGTVSVTVPQVSPAIALPGALIEERGDGHAIAKHGTSALEIIEKQRKSDLDVWYSGRRETALVVGCDCSTGMCGVMVLGVRGYVLDPMMFQWGDLDGRLELTHYTSAAPRIEKTVRRDGYIRVFPPVPKETVPEVWNRCITSAYTP